MGKQVVRHPASSVRWPCGVKRPGSASAAAEASCGQVANYGALPLLTRDELSTGGSSAPPRDPPTIVTLGYLQDAREGPDTAKAPSFVSAYMLTCLPPGCALVHRENQWKCQALAQCHAGVGNGDLLLGSGHAGEGVDGAVMVL